MSEDILEILGAGPLTREIVRFCSEPRITKDITTRISGIRERFGFKKILDYVNANRVATQLRRLENVNAITYDEKTGKWKSEPLALESLAKYFGIE